MTWQVYLDMQPLPQSWYCCSVAKSCLTLCDPMDCSMPGFPVLHYLPEYAQTHVHWVSDAIQPSHPLSPPSPPTLNLARQQGLFQWVSSSHQVVKVLELQLQHQSFQWVYRVDYHNHDIEYLLHQKVASWSLAINFFPLTSGLWQLLTYYLSLSFCLFQNFVEIEACIL